MAELTLSQDRQELFFEAACEIDKLSRVLPDLVPLTEDQAHYAVKGIAGRMASLTEALIRGLDDKSYSDSELRRVVHFNGAFGATEKQGGAA